MSTTFNFVNNVELNIVEKFFDPFQYQIHTRTIAAHITAKTHQSHLVVYAVLMLSTVNNVFVLTWTTQPGYCEIPLKIINKMIRFIK